MDHQCLSFLLDMIRSSLVEKGNPYRSDMASASLLCYNSVGDIL